MAGSQTEFPVVEAGVPVGVLGSATLVAALSKVGPEAPVGRVIGRDGATCEADERLEDALARVRASGRGALPVTSRGALVGLLTLDNVGELLLVRRAIRRFHGDAEA
jgi:CBS domain-containing protein